MGLLDGEKEIPQKSPATVHLSSSIVQVQGNLSETAGRADLQEQALAKLKVKGRAASVGPY